ncbi:MAG TPA: hypothetical protein VJG32_22050 [Anaerolineae bacterium]|nr:hypothetical protein [Anaerolineae bacterium]
MTTKRILLLDGRDGSYWMDTLRSAACTLDGAIEVVDEASLPDIHWQDYDLVILNSSVSSDLPSTISWIRSQDPTAQIVVFSSAPAWKQAREVMLAGAIDYAHKSLNKEYILSTLERNLARQASSRRRRGQQ